MKPVLVPLSTEDKALIRDALQGEAAHLRGLAAEDGPHVAPPQRRQWRQKAEACAELAQRVQHAEDTTSFRSGK